MAEEQQQEAERQTTLAEEQQEEAERQATLADEERQTAGQATLIAPPASPRRAAWTRKHSPRTTTTRHCSWQ